ncbi:MAG: MerR family transcriptional regulator [Clostridia bacterium]|nr:MerR family transcriptional regulator [Clostridia bacterium]
MNGKDRLLTVGEAAARAGVSIRTLRHYDAIGLLRPQNVTSAGYRLYGEEEMRKLERILFFRELDFPLDEVKAILSNPAYNEREAIERQLALMKKKRERLDWLILRLEGAVNGECDPEFEVFGMKEIEKMKNEYAQEVRQRWGKTKAYAQSEEKHAAYGEAQYGGMLEEMDALMAEFAAVRGVAAADARVQALVERWKACITKWHYDCTDEILDGLGKMYVCDERFTANIDRHGEGTAKCMSDAIAAYIDAKLA